MDDSTELRISNRYCNCGTPDPLNEGHAESCMARKIIEAAKIIDKTLKEINVYT